MADLQLLQPLCETRRACPSGIARGRKPAQSRLLLLARRHRRFARDVPALTNQSGNGITAGIRYAKAAGLEIVATVYDAAVSGADPVTDRPGFAEMLERLMSNGAQTIVVESPDRFARDLMVQLAGHDMLKGVTLIAASAPTFFVEDTPERRSGPAGSRSRRAIREGDHSRQAGGRSEAEASRYG